MRLGDVCKVVSGSTPKTSNEAYWGGDIKWITPAELDDDSHIICDTVKHLTSEGFASASLHTLPKGTVLLTTRAPIGKVAIAGEPMCCNQGFKNLVCSDAVYNEFLFRQLKARTAELQAMGRGATFKELSKRNVETFEIALPSLARQHEAVERLESVGLMVSLANRQLVLLDDLVKSRFVEMFGDPVENPYGWEKKKLPELGDLKNGVNFKSVDKGYEIRCLGVGDFKNRSRIDDMGFVSRVHLNGEPNKAQILRDGDIIFVRSNGNKELVGRCLAIFPGDEKVTFSGFCIRFRLATSNLDLMYLLGSLKADSMRRAMTGRGANIQNLSQKILAEVEIPVPPLDLQRSFADFVAEVDKSRFVVQRQIAQLQTLYDSLAQEYFG